MSATNIFARDASDGRQYLAYGMTLSVAEDLAMILPLLVPRGTSDDALTFIDLSAYADFFGDLAKGFPEPRSRSSRGRSEAEADDRLLLEVVDVGSFEASFVPTIRDFDRLDPRFRLPADVWSAVPGYDHAGFAVFKLRKGNERVHPMAFIFPRAVPTALFFPTVHIHDGEVHPEADFDHTLYCQRSPRVSGGPGEGWRSSSRAARFVEVEKTRGLVDGDRSVHRLRLNGRGPNRDVYVED